MVDRGGPLTEPRVRSGRRRATLRMRPAPVDDPALGWMQRIAEPDKI
jgi:hypothetical protein